MIAKANLLLSKVKPEFQAETIRLEKIKAERLQIQQLEAEKRMAPENLKSRLETMTAEFNWDTLKAHALMKAEECALMKAEEEKKIRMSAFEAKIKSYERHPWFATPCIFFMLIIKQ